MYIRALKPDEQAGIEAGFSLLECLYPVPEKPTQHPLDISDSYPLDEKGTLYRPAACRVHVSACKRYHKRGPFAIPKVSHFPQESAMLERKFEQSGGKERCIPWHFEMKFAPGS